MANSNSGMRLAVLGAGKMGGILIDAFVKQRLVPAKNISATVQHLSRDRKNGAALGIALTSDNRAAVKHADVILLCVKPQTVARVVDEVRDRLSAKTLLISIAASVPTGYIERRLKGKVPVIRAMPNTPSMVGEGITAIAKGKFAEQKDVDTAQRLFGAVGKTVVTDEKNMDAITGLSASGPAFIYIILESLAEGGVKAGLSRKLARRAGAGRGALLRRIEGTGALYDHLLGGRLQRLLAAQVLPHLEPRTSACSRQVRRRAAARPVPCACPGEVDTGSPTSASEATPFFERLWTCAKH